MTDVLTPEAEIRRICHEWRGEHRIATTMLVRWLLAQLIRSRRQIAHLTSTLRADLAAERQARADTGRHLAEAVAQLGWIDDAEEGRDVPDFAASFPLVRAILDSRQARARLEQAIMFALDEDNDWFPVKAEFLKALAYVRALLPVAGER